MPPKVYHAGHKSLLLSQLTDPLHGEGPGLLNTHWSVKWSCYPGGLCTGSLPLL